MTQAEILVPLRGDASDLDLLQQGLALADVVDAKVASVFAQLDPTELMAWSADGAFATTSASLIQSARDGNDQAWSEVKSRVDALASGHPGLTVERVIGLQDRLLARRAALSDVVLFACETARGKTTISPVFEALMMDAHAPIFIPRSSMSQLTGTALIAWDGSVEAGRAAKAALPLLRKAGKVIIIQSVGALDDEGKHLSDPTRLQDWLSRQGIKAQVDLLDASKDAATEILKACTAHGAGLLVAGAYGHSRAREFVFGGVTRTLLKTTSTPSLLLCH
ncbi:universal stress protein [Aquidulcibacter sp.]|uniref:universal stress protein n=1 Tax=Aquidulcibacter sp. TaxID=2052990 RepID=UPI0025C47BA1|nr:universal stress protein [Aquidulcibacter sp.]MCA3694581.1 universal stress protein [Aquidulcibacter sp.]